MSSAYETEWVRQPISSSHITRKEVHFSCCLSSFMPGRSTPTFARIRIVTLSQEGLSWREVSWRPRVNQSDVVWTCRRDRDTGTVDDMRRSGRPKASTAVDYLYLRISARRNPESNATMLNNAFSAATGRRLSTQTVRNRLHDAQLHSRRPWRGPHLTPRHHAARYRWPTKTRQYWHHVLFIDECRIYLQPDSLGDLFGGSLVSLNVLCPVSPSFVIVITLLKNI